MKSKVCKYNLDISLLFMNVFYDSKFLMTSGRNFLFLTFCLAKVVTPLVTEEVEAVSELAPAPTYCCGLGTVYWIGDIP